MVDIRSIFVSLCIEGVDLNKMVDIIKDIKNVSLCIEGVDLNDCIAGHCNLCTAVSLCIEGVDLNNPGTIILLSHICLPLHRGSGFKRKEALERTDIPQSPSA